MFHGNLKQLVFTTTCLAVMLVMFLLFLPKTLSAQSNKNVATQAIQSKYQQMNGQNGVLGKAKTNIKTTPDKKGYFQDYERGAIYWNSFYGAYEVHGSIFLKWHAVGRAGGILGYPTTDEKPAADGRGRYSRFEYGVIYWHPDIGKTAYEVHGGILSKWDQLGLERSPLGYPISDEQKIPDGSGQMSLFQYGAIYWIRGSGGATVEYLRSNSSVFGKPKWTVAPFSTPAPEPTKCTSGICETPSQRGFIISNLHVAECSSPDYDACVGANARTQFASPDNICLRWRESGKKNESFEVTIWQDNVVLASEKFTTRGGQDMCKSFPITLSNSGSFKAEVLYNFMLDGSVGWQVNGATSPASTPNTGNQPVSNGLHFRNNMDSTIWLALGSLDASKDEWVSQGWYEIAAGQTRSFATEGFTHQHYYFYANSTHYFWEGKEDIYFWVHPTLAFGPLSHTLDASTAQSRGYIQKSFRHIDLGNNTSYIYEFNPN